MIHFLFCLIKQDDFKRLSQLLIGYFLQINSSKIRDAIVLKIKKLLPSKPFSNISLRWLRLLKVSIKRLWDKTFWHIQVSPLIPHQGLTNLSGAIFERTSTNHHFLLSLIKQSGLQILQKFQRSTPLKSQLLIYFFFIVKEGYGNYSFPAMRSCESNCSETACQIYSILRRI